MVEDGAPGLNSGQRLGRALIMTQTKPASDRPTSSVPQPGQVRFDDISQALRLGMGDFLAAPLFGLFFGAICAAGGMLILGSMSVLQAGWMMIPIAVGFPLVGPFVAVGLYEVSRRRAAGIDLKWSEILTVVAGQRERQFAYSGIVIMCIFWVWIFIARILFALFLGAKSLSGLLQFLTVATTTPEGIGFLLVGCAFGAVLALVLFSATVMSLPMLIDRDVDLISAVISSFQTVANNFGPMLIWAAIVVVTIVLAMLPLFAGLLLVLPVLGHATWHLYARARANIGEQT
jgi:uncharacterized membrane protein